ncbi:phage shock protein PspA [Pseudoalteromonas denitrificans]|uniref:Phage shock protein A (PspA) family protein n=1 Tax=Pseudoalteromonas denitrificans DSM 6059 TaxID=1123010 RepID=A0A1I1PD30_9GAMM|nr:phage shock protein PspA [Pseudoalteromonas denitrificans]SFD07757.1 phage shock protein A (PspA) family protein [Pseudoalteromonas denitrificans DSM 6059]
MGVFTRLTDIIQSNIASALDKAEDPEKLVRLMIQEMEQTLAEVISTQAEFLADKKTLNRELESANQSIIFWQKKAELALEKQRDDLAKAALIEKNKATKQANSLKDELAKIDSALNQLKADVDSLQVKLNQIKIKQASLMQKEESALSRLKVRTHLHSNQIKDALARFELVERKVDEIEAKVESYDLGSSSLQQQFDEIEKNDEIESELTQLKKKLAA